MLGDERDEERQENTSVARRKKGYAVGGREISCLPVDRIYIERERKHANVSDDGGISPLENGLGYTKNNRGDT
jgi:hypothetical protein